MLELSVSGCHYVGANTFYSSSLALFTVNKAFDTPIQLLNVSMTQVDPLGVLALLAQPAIKAPTAFASNEKDALLVNIL
jgi:hypothetical protein